MSNTDPSLRAFIAQASELFGKIEGVIKLDGRVVMQWEWDAKKQQPVRKGTYSDKA